MAFSGTGLFRDRSELALWEIVFFKIEGEENSSLTP
jgi:hypothetical protein